MTEALLTANPLIPDSSNFVVLFIGVIHVGLVVWAVVAASRNTVLHATTRAALAVLAVAVPLLGPLLAIASMRLESTRSPREPHNAVRRDRVPTV